MNPLLRTQYDDQNKLVQDFINECSPMDDIMHNKRIILISYFEKVNKTDNLVVVDWINSIYSANYKIVSSGADALSIISFIKKNLNNAKDKYYADEKIFMESKKKNTKSEDNYYGRMKGAIGISLFILGIGVYTFS